MNTLFAILFYVLGHLFAWFQFNLQFVSEWWRDKPLLTVCLFAIPMSYCFWHATRLFVDQTGLLWTGRLMGFGIGIVIFSLLTAIIVNESPFNIKTMSCLFLSTTIVLIQVFVD